MHVELKCILLLNFTLKTKLISEIALSAYRDQ